MHTAKLRQVGGSVMVAIPPALLDQLGLAASVSVGVAIENGRLIIEKHANRPKYRLADLLAEGTPAILPSDQQWRGGGPAGSELI
jgi:antitoxin ChpS